MRARDIAVRLLGSLLFAFCLLTATGILWRVADFGQYSTRLVGASLYAAAGAGLVAGFWTSGHLRWLLVVAAASLLSLCWWVFAFVTRGENFNEPGAIGDIKIFRKPSESTGP